MKFSSKFLFAYDSLERADLKAEFGKPYISSSYRYDGTQGMKFVSGYCGVSMGVAVNGVLDSSMELNTYKLIFKNLQPWRTKHTRHDLADPTAKVGAAAIAGEGAKEELGISALSGVILVGETLYKRLTLNDVGRKGCKGLLKQANKRLIWFLRPIGSPSQDVLDSLLEKVL